MTLGRCGLGRLATTAALLLLAAAGCGRAEPGAVADQRRPLRAPRRVVLFVASPALWVASDTATVSDSLRFGAFGIVRLLRGTPGPAQVVIFASGDGGWDPVARHIARQLASADALVIGVDSRAYLRRLAHGAGRCTYPAADLEALSQYVQKRLGRARYVPPVLVGHSSGAALVYAALGQAPPTTFAGGVSLGFCTTLAGTRPFCAGPGGLASRVVPRAATTPGGDPLVRVLPGPALAAPWVVLQGASDRACQADSARAFVERVAGGRFVAVPGLGHGFGKATLWMPAFRDALGAMRARAGTDRMPRDAAVRDLPLIEVPARGPPGGADADLLAVVVSGDGGWASIDRRIGGVLAARGIPVVGLDALQYFWPGRTPERAAADLARIVAHYLTAWGKRRVLLVGYSRGADVLPFMVTRLPGALRDRVALVALLGAAHEASFEFHLTDWVGGGRGAGDRPTLPEITRLTGRPVLCIYGQAEDDTVCPAAARAGAATAVVLPGGHHFGGDYEAIADRVLAALAP